MPITKLIPALAFDGTAAQAIKLYEKALGAKTETVMRFGDAPAMGHITAPEAKDRIMHSLVHIGAGLVMIMDAPPSAIVATESNVQISLEFDSVAELTKSFDALAAGGKITMAIHDAFWGSKFGMLTDPYGIRWMLSCDPKKP